jgi:hypothetical protein
MRPSLAERHAALHTSGDQKIRRDQHSSILQNGDRLAGVRPLEKKPFERNARVDDEDNLVSQLDGRYCRTFKIWC